MKNGVKKKLGIGVKLGRGEGNYIGRLEGRGKRMMTSLIDWEMGRASFAIMEIWTPTKLSSDFPLTSFPIDQFTFQTTEMHKLLFLYHNLQIYDFNYA
jgi:hypothetical protein